MSQPIATYRERRVSASVFENEKKDGSGTFLSATVERSFQDEDGAYRSSNSYIESELTALAAVALQARAKIREERLKHAPDAEEQE